MRINSYLFVVLVFFFASCIEEYNPQINDYMNSLVVEGEITNEPGPYTIMLSETSKVNDTKLIPVNNANVTILDDLGNSEILLEQSPGLYSTQEVGIKGDVGRHYKVTIEYNGKNYQTDFVELKEPIEIDSVYAEIEHKGLSEGLQFFIDTKKHEKSKYLFWKLTETYKFEADDYPLDFIYLSEDSIVIADPDAIHVCWQTKSLFDIYTTTTENLNESKLTGFQLHYINTETKRLSIRYSLLVEQYSISKDTYNYWTEMKEQNDETGSLYTKQPYLLKSSVYNVDNLEEAVLGYFMVAGVSKKRIFVDRPSVNFYLDLCKATHDNYLRWSNSEPPRSFPVYIKLVNGELGRAGIGCFDCRVEGGTTTKPDFWVD